MMGFGKPLVTGTFPKRAEVPSWQRPVKPSMMPWAFDVTELPKAVMKFKRDKGIEDRVP